MIAVSLNVGGGVRLIKPAKLYTCTQKHYIHDEDERTAPGVCGNGSVPLSHSENVVTRIGMHTSRNDILIVAQRYGTIAANIRNRASVLVVFVVFLRAPVLAGDQ